MAESTHLEHAREIATDRLKLKVGKIRRLGDGTSSFTYKLTIDDCHECHALQSGTQPGTVPLPPQTRYLILRLPNLDAALDNAARIENEVAVMALLRSAGAFKSLIPDVYSWTNYNENTGDGWILFQYMSGTNIRKLHRFPFHRQKIILKQLAQITKTLQELPLPETLKGYGGARFNDDGDVVSGLAGLPIGGPYQTYQNLYRGLLRRQIELADTNEVLKGWRDTGLRERIDKFLAEGIDAVLERAVNPTRRCLVHGGIEVINFLVDPYTFQITALYSFQYSHIASALEEYMYSFPDMDGHLTGPYNTRDELLVTIRNALINGFPKPVPKGSIQWRIIKAWDDELANAGALRPATIPYAADISTLHWFAQEICPFYFLKKSWFKDWAGHFAEKVTKQKNVLELYLEGWGY